MVLGKLPVPRRPTKLYNSRARAYCACSRCGWGWFGHFFSLIHHFSFLSPSLWETARYRLKYCLKGPLSPTQPTNQPILFERSLLNHESKLPEIPTASSLQRRQISLHYDKQNNDILYFSLNLKSSLKHNVKCKYTLQMR